jgi:alpha-tubulin suppressor-like RCC1 family protein
MTPKITAVRTLGPLRFTRSPFEVALRHTAAILVAVVLAACNETSAPILRYPLLDEAGQANWKTVSVGAEHSCALVTDGTAYCWGSNQYGQLGVAVTDTVCTTSNTSFACSDVPIAVSTNLKFVSISAGQRHTCAITVENAAYCWGANDQGQAGGGMTGPVLRAVPGTLPWMQISAGYAHTCAVRSDGALFCWGQNDRGQLGTDAVSTSSTPLRVSLANPIAAVSTGQSRTCARTTSGVVYCWGAIWVVRQGGLELSRSQVFPQRVQSAPAMSWLSVGARTTCGVDLSGVAYCWEANPDGSIGNGTFDGSTVPMPVAIDSPFIQVSGGLSHSCGITNAGIGYCWGDDSSGQLGVPSAQITERCGERSTLCSSRPVAVLGRQSFVEISAGLGNHVCGVTTRGNLYCWGLGSFGQRGDGTLGTAVSTPITVAAPTAAVLPQ